MESVDSHVQNTPIELNNTNDAPESEVVPRSANATIDEQLAKKIETGEKLKSAMTPRQARRVAGQGKDIEQEFRERESNNANPDQQIRFADEKVSKKRTELDDSTDLGGSKDSVEVSSSGSLVAEVKVSKKNRNRVKSESYNRTVDARTKSRGSVDALDLDLKFSGAKNNENEKSAVHKVKKHRSKSRVRAESDLDSNSDSDDGDSSEMQTKKRPNKNYSGRPSQYMVSTQPAFQGQQPIMHPFGYSFQHPAFMPQGSYITTDYMHQNQAWNPQQQQWMPAMTAPNFAFPYYSSNVAEKDLSVRPVIASQEVPSVAGIERSKSAAGVIGSDIEMTELIPNPPKSPPPKSAIKSPRKEVTAGKELDTIDSDTAPRRGSTMSLSKQAAIDEPKVSASDSTKTDSGTKSELISEKINPSKFKTELDSPPAEISFAGSVAQNLAKSVPGIVSQEQEFHRLAAMYSLGMLNDDKDQPRLNKITQMTARLLGRSCCVLSLVDTDKVYWKSVAWSGSNNVKSIKEEPRYESFCSWVVQDDTGRGVTILDSKTDPRCTHMRVKPGLEFYAGVPIFLGGKHKIGALSIQGPASAQISVIDMNILHEMATWASGELDTIIQQKQINDRENLLGARVKLSVLSYSVGKESSDPRIMEKSLAIIRDALNAQFVLLLKLVPDAKSFQSILQAYSVASNAQTSGNLPIGEDMFRDLCFQTLKKEVNNCLFIENLKTGAVTKDVDRYLNKKINRCLGEIVWSSGGPSAILAVFFDGVYRIISADELSFVREIIPTFSAMLEQQELKESFQQAAMVYKSLGAAAKKHSIAFGASQGLAPCFLILEPKLMSFKGYPRLETIFTLPLERRVSAKDIPTLSVRTGAKGQALAQQLAQNDFSMAALSKGKHTSEPKLSSEIQPLESFEIFNDLSAMLESLSEKHNLKKPRRFGQQYYVLSNYGPDTGTFENTASFAQELLFALDTYNQSKKRKLKVNIGIHTDFLSLDLANDSAGLKDQLIAIANGAYQLESRAESILVSEIFYHQTKEYCSYEQGNPMVIRGQGAFSTYKLIGIAQNSVKAIVEPMKENGVNNKGSMIASKIPFRQVAPEIMPEEGFTKPKSAFKKSQCTIL